jgi:hypothetical protein
MQPNLIKVKIKVKIQVKIKVIYFSIDFYLKTNPFFFSFSCFLIFLLLI